MNNETEKNFIFTRHIAIKRLPFLIVSLIGLISIFELFLPTIKTVNGSNSVLVLFYQSFVFMEDRSNTGLFLSVLLLIFGYIFSVLSLPVGFFSTFIQEKKVKTNFVLEAVITLLSFACNLASVILLFLCKNTSIHVGFGSYIILIVSGLVSAAFILSSLLLRNNEKTL